MVFIIFTFGSVMASIRLQDRSDRVRDNIQRQSKDNQLPGPPRTLEPVSSFSMLKHNVGCLRAQGRGP